MSTQTPENGEDRQDRGQAPQPSWNPARQPEQGGHPAHAAPGYGTPGPQAPGPNAPAPGAPGGEAPRYPAPSYPQQPQPAPQQPYYGQAQPAPPQQHRGRPVPPVPPGPASATYPGAPQAFPPYGQPPFNQAQFGQAQFNQAPFNQPQYGQQPYGGRPYPGPYQQGQPGQGMPPAGPYGQPYYQPYAPPRPTGLSVTSMILGIVGVVSFGTFIFPQILAVVFGHIGLKKEPAGRGMAIAGLITGYIMVAATIVFWLFVFTTSSRYGSSY